MSDGSYDEHENADLATATGWVWRMLKGASKRVPGQDGLFNRYLDAAMLGGDDDRHVETVGDLEPDELRRQYADEYDAFDPSGMNDRDADLAAVARLTEATFELHLASGQTFRVVVEEVS